MVNAYNATQDVQSALGLPLASSAPPITQLCSPTFATSIAAMLQAQKLASTSIKQQILAPHVTPHVTIALAQQIINV